MAKSDVDFAQYELENAHISIVFLGHLSFLPACAAILNFKNGHGSSLGFSIGVGDLCLLYLCSMSRPRRSGSETLPIWYRDIFGGANVCNFTFACIFLEFDRVL